MQSMNGASESELAMAGNAHGVLVYTRYLDSEERRTLPAGVDERRDLSRWLACDFGYTLAELQQLVLCDMQRKGMDMHVEARHYVVVHQSCAIGSRPSYGGCRCNSKAFGHQRFLRTGEQPPALTLAELGLQSGHHAYVALERPAAGVSLAGLSLE